MIMLQGIKVHRHLKQGNHPLCQGGRSQVATDNTIYENAVLTLWNNSITSHRHMETLSKDNFN